MNIRAHHLVASLLAGAILISTTTWFAVRTPTAEAACGTGSSVVITTPSSNTTPLSGIRSLRAYSTPTTASGMTFMLISPQQKPLGEAIQNGSEWRLDWDTRNAPNGTYQLIAVAHFGSATTLDCASPAVTFAVQNTATQAPKLMAVITPDGWQTPGGTSRTFTVDAIYIDQYGRQSHVAPSSTSPPQWQTTIGRLTAASGASTVLQAGTVVGTGQLKAKVTYNSFSAISTAEIKVTQPLTTSTRPATSPQPSGSPSPSPSPDATTPGSDATTSDTTRLATMPTIFRPAEPTNSKPVVPLSALSCLEKKVGQARFNEISSGKNEPTAAERRLAAECFSGPAPIPAILAPIAPTRINTLEQTKDLVTVSEIKNTTITNTEGKKVTGVLLSGKGVPNSNVFIYIFSDPLVLRAQTDTSGAWKYVLETPLEPGKHEVYAVAEKDTGTFVRSSAIPVSIAAASDGSPDGSLIIEQKLSSAQVGFIILAGLMVLASIAVVFTVLRRRRRLDHPASLTGTVPPTTIIKPTLTPAQSQSSSTPPPGNGPKV